MQDGMTRRGFAALLSASAGAVMAGCENEPPPPPTDALAGDDASGLAARVRAQEISVEDVVNTAITRMNAANTSLKFLAADTFERARAYARTHNTVSGPFAGAPVLISDMADLPGVPTRYGSRAYANAENAQRSAPYDVAALIEAGAIPLGKATTAEFGLALSTEPALSGPVLNPWNLNYAAGGAYGGAAAAVASGAVAMAQGRDSRGELRMSAATCGVVGFTPSRGRILRRSADAPNWDLGAPACLARSVRDAAAWLAAAERATQSIELPAIGMVSRSAHRRIRIGRRSADWMGQTPEPASRAAFEQISNRCVNLGHDLVEATAPIDAEPFSTDCILLWSAEAAARLAQAKRDNPGVDVEDLVEPFTLGLARQFETAPDNALQDALGRLQRISGYYARAFEGFEIMLSPTTPSTAPILGDIAPTEPFPATFDRASRLLGFTTLTNVAGAPAISLPLGMSPEGLPIGVQLSAQRGGERLLLELALQLEASEPWVWRHPSVWTG